MSERFTGAGDAEKNFKSKKSELNRFQKLARLGAIASIIAGGATAGRAATESGSFENLKTTVTESLTNFDEKINQETLKKIESSKVESFEVVEWGKEDTSSLSDMRVVRTISELREEAGWDESEETEFVYFMSNKYPESINRETLTIQPDNYKVPIKNKGE